MPTRCGAQAAAHVQILRFLREHIAAVAAQPLLCCATPGPQAKQLDRNVRSPEAPGSLAPFGNVAFAVLWIATGASNIGTWMQDVGAAWPMTKLSPSPLLVAPVQASTTLLMSMFALLAGAVAPTRPRRPLGTGATSVLQQMEGGHRHAPASDRDRCVLPGQPTSKDVGVDLGPCLHARG